MVFIAQGIRLELLTTAPMYSSNSLQVDFFISQHQKNEQSYCFLRKKLYFCNRKRNL